MADLKLVGAVAIKVRPDARGFRGETQRQVSKELAGIEGEIEVKAKVKADTTQAKADAKAAKKDIEKDEITLRVGFDYASLKAAQRQLDKAVKDLQLDKLPVKLDLEGIAEAQAKIDEMMASATIDMKFTPDDEGAAKILAKIAQIRKEKLEVELTFGISDEELDLLEEAFKSVPKMELTYTNDRASIEKAIAAVKAEMDKIDAYELPVFLDEESLQIALEQLEGELSGVPVKLKVNYDDQASLKAVQSRLQAMLVELGSEPLDVQFNEEAIREQLDRISGMIKEDVTEAFADPSVVKISYNLNRTSLTNAIASINRELDKIHAAELTIKTNPLNLIYERAKLEEALANEPVELTVNYDDQDSLKATKRKLQQMLEEVRPANLFVQFDEEKIREELRRIDSMIEEEVKDKNVQLPVHTTGLEIVARQLQFASRARRVPFYVVVDAKSVAIAEGILRSLTGLNALQSFGRGLESIITKFDTFSLKTGAWSTAIGSLLDAFVFLGSSLFSVGAGMAQIVGLAALGPAAFGALASTMIIFQGVFKDFGAAVNGDQKAIDKLTVSGQKAAAQIRVSFQEIRETVSKNFWGEAGDAMLRFTETALPAFSRGLANTSGRLGKVFGGILDSFTNLAAAGGLDKMFDNLVLMFENASSGATALWDALNILGLQGSEFLPQFGTWLSEISVQFRNWIDVASKNGDITAWINGGVIALKDIWYSAGAVIDQFKAMARAADLGGLPGLDDFRRGMEHVARVMLAEPFQSRMATIFSGARSGAGALNDGIKDLGTTLGEASFWTGNLLYLLGKLGGDVLSGASTTIGNLTFQEGMTDALSGMIELVDELAPSFDRLGDFLGTVASVAGEVFRNLAPIFNVTMGIIDDAVSEVAGNLERFIPSLTGLGTNLAAFFRGPVMFAVGVLNNFLEILNNLPGPLRDMTIAFGTFLLLRNQFGAFAGALNGLWNNMTTTAVPKTATMVSGVTGNFVRMADGSLRQVTRMKDGTDRALNGFGQIFRTHIGTADVELRKFTPDTVVPRRVQAMSTTSATHMRGFRDIFANAMTTATSAIGAFAPAPLISGKLGTVVSATSGHMSRIAGAVGHGVDNMTSAVGRFRPDLHITERLSGVARAIPGIVGKINGALSLIGGLPGLALGLIGVAISAIGGNAAEASANVDRLKESLDKVTGGASKDTLAIIAEQISEVDESSDAFANFWRGVGGGAKSGLETIGNLGIKIKDVAKIITGSKEQYDTFIGQLKDLGSADLNKVADFLQNGNLPAFKPLAPGDENTSEQFREIDNIQRVADVAQRMGLSPDRLRELQGSLGNLTGEIEEQRKAWELAQLKAALYADVLGTTSERAQEVSSLTAILGDHARDASTKIDAINRSLSILNDNGLSQQEASINKIDALEAAVEQARAIAEVINGSRDTIIAGNGLLNEHSKAGRDLFKIMSEQADNVKILAQSTYDAAILDGKTASQAMQLAKDVIKAGQADLKAIADAAGLDVGLLQTQWDQFFGKDWTLTATFTGTIDLFLAAKKAAEEAGLAFDQEKFTAWLLANPDLAKVTTDDVIAYIKGNYTQSENKAKLTADNTAAIADIAAATGMLDAYKNGNYAAILRALNEAGPGVQSAINEIKLRVTDPFFAAKLYALLDSGSVSYVQGQLDILAQPRLVKFGVQITDLQRDASLKARETIQATFDTYRPGAAQPVPMANGGFYRAYANGGFESHVAQIARPGVVPRVWAERETGGEAYLPLAASKRPRSVSILKQVAGMFGYQISKAREFSNGGTTSPVTTNRSTSATVNIGTLNTNDPDGAVRKLRQAQRDALAVHGITEGA